jgi:death-on-curing family protein
MPKFIRKAAVISEIQRCLELFGGLSGLRDEGALDAALARPQNKHVYGENDLCTLAAAYAFGIAKNHPFTDGNKRAALMTAHAFLIVNGYDLAVDKVELTRAVLNLASSDLSEEDFGLFLRAHIVAL